jgi:hypothetical protein
MSVGDEIARFMESLKIGTDVTGVRSVFGDEEAAAGVCAGPRSGDAG